MSSLGASHVAITVSDLEQGEAYYQTLFDMEVVTREEFGPDGGRQLPRNKNWSDVRRAGIDPYMVALRRGGFVLALFDEASPFIRGLGLPHSRPLFIGLALPADEIVRVRGRLTSEEWMKSRAASGIATELAGNSAAALFLARVASDAG